MKYLNLEKKQKGYKTMFIFHDINCKDNGAHQAPFTNMDIFYSTMDKNHRSNSLGKISYPSKNI